MKHLSDEYPVVCAIDSRGRKVAEVTLLPGIDPIQVKHALVELLNRADPVRTLTLVGTRAAVSQMSHGAAATMLGRRVV